MRNLIQLLCVFLIVASCSSDSNDTDDGFIGTVVEREYTISNSEAITHYLGQFGESGSAIIVIQAKHFSISEINDTNYLYEPADDFLGEDYVEIMHTEINKDPNGNDVSKNTKTKITITITQ